MFCEGCGKPLNEKAQFCPNCGAETSIREAGAPAIQSLGTPEPQRKTGKRYVWLFLLLIPILFSALNAIPATVLTITIFGWLFVYQYAGVRRRTALALTGAAVVAASTIQILQRSSEPRTAGTPVVSAVPVSAWKPNSPAPQFTIYRAKANMPVSVLVPVASTDDELKELLWFFRNKVKMKEFKELGIEKAAQTQWGNDRYLSGLLAVYRGSKCAAEEFTAGNGPCGKGDHDDAYYQWGLEGDPNKDVGSIRANGSFVTVFDFHDGWKLPSEVQAELDKREQLELETRQQFARELQQRVTAMGFDMNLRVHGEGINEGRLLNVESEMFKDTNARVRFINDILPQWKTDLCKAGFRLVRVTQGGTFDEGREYALGCTIH
jgi:hypothetical protein